MSTTAIFLIVAVVIAIGVALLASRGGGPRVTTVETRRRTEEGEKGE
jgi:hypothetical protein